MWTHANPGFGGMPTLQPLANPGFGIHDWCTCIPLVVLNPGLCRTNNIVTCIVTYVYLLCTHALRLFLPIRVFAMLLTLQLTRQKFMHSTLCLLIRVFVYLLGTHAWHWYIATNMVPLIDYTCRMAVFANPGFVMRAWRLFLPIRVLHIPCTTFIHCN
jgi:ethanolamine transporter EutH